MQLKAINSPSTAPKLTIDPDGDGDVAIYAVLPDGTRIKLAYIGSRDGVLYTTCVNTADRSALRNFICFANSNEWKVL